MMKWNTLEIRFPILILEPTKVYMPSYVTVNDSHDEQSLQIFNLCLKCLRDKGSCRKIHEWLVTSAQIKTMTLYKRDERCLFLYVHSDDFQMYFPSKIWRQAFYNKVCALTADQEGIFQDLESEAANADIDFEYDLDDHNQKVVLGKGTLMEI